MYRWAGSGRWYGPGATRVTSARSRELSVTRGRCRRMRRPGAVDSGPRNRPRRPGSLPRRASRLFGRLTWPGPSIGGSFSSASYQLSASGRQKLATKAPAPLLPGVACHGQPTPRRWALRPLAPGRGAQRPTRRKTGVGRQSHQVAGPHSDRSPVRAGGRRRLPAVFFLAMGPPGPGPPESRSPAPPQHMCRAG